MHPRFVALCAMVALTACSIKGQSGYLPVPATPAGSVARGYGKLVLRVTVPKADGRRARYVSPATEGMTVDIAGPTTVKQTVGLTLGSSGCKSAMMTAQCTLVVALKSCPSSKNCYTATVATYDKFAHGAIPHDARVLSADQKFAFSIGSGSTLVPLALYGIPVAAVVLPGTASALTGNQKSGFTIPKCATASQGVSVYGADADGNLIAGAGAPSVTLVSGNSAQLAVGKSHPSSPNDYELMPPKAPLYPYGGHAVDVTAKVTPGSASGAAAKSVDVRFTYSGDVCGVFTEFALPKNTSDPFGIVAGPDGNLWFTELKGDRVGRMSTAGAIHEFNTAPGSHPAGITVGPDRNLWFVDSGTGAVERITTAGAAKKFHNSLPTSTPVSITTGPNKTLWFTEESANNVVKMSLSGTMTAYGVPTSGATPFGITEGSDGNMWFTELDTDKIGEVTPGGSFTETALASNGNAPADIVAGPDGALWFAACTGNTIGRFAVPGVINPGGVTSAFPLPEMNSGPAYLTVGPDAAIWFAENSGNRIGRMTLGGEFDEFAVPSPASIPFGITKGPDGAIWFTELQANKIARLR